VIVPPRRPGSVAGAVYQVESLKSRPYSRNAKRVIGRPQLSGDALVRAR
jgi:hypothetical protein